MKTQKAGMLITGKSCSKDDVITLIALIQHSMPFNYDVPIHHEYVYNQDRGSQIGKN